MIIIQGIRSIKDYLIWLYVTEEISILVSFLHSAQQIFSYSYQIHITFQNWAYCYGVCDCSHSTGYGAIQCWIQTRTSHL